MKYRLKWGLISAVTGFVIFSCMFHLLFGWGAIGWFDKRALIPVVVSTAFMFIAMFVIASKPKPFVPHPRDIMTVYRSTIEDWHKLVKARLNGATWSDNDDLRDMEARMRRILDHGTVIRRGQP